jgi:hypothetical protein
MHDTRLAMDHCEEVIVHGGRPNGGSRLDAEETRQPRSRVADALLMFGGSRASATTSPGDIIARSVGACIDVVPGTFSTSRGRGARGGARV